MDSSIYIAWLRKRVDFPHRLESRLRAGRLLGCGMVRAEVLRGVADPRQRNRVAEFFQLFPEVPTDGKLWEAVVEMAWNLDRRGRVLPLSDIVIGCCALRAGAAVVSSDPHFGHISGLKVFEDLDDAPGS